MGANSSYSLREVRTYAQIFQAAADGIRGITRNLDGVVIAMHYPAGYAYDSVAAAQADAYQGIADLFAKIAEAAEVARA